MRKIIIPVIFLVILVLGSNQLVASAQENEFTITLNPGATNSESQNPMSPSANITVPAGTNVTWINNDLSPHMLVSGTPEEGPDNIFYGSFFGAGENYTVTFDEPGSYSYYDPVSSHIIGIITVENPEVSSDQGLNIDTSSAGGIDDSLAASSNTSDVVGSNSNDFNASEGNFASFPSSSIPSFTTDNTSDQSSVLSSLLSDQTLASIINKVGPLLRGLMNGSGSSSSSSLSSPTFSQSNESFGVGEISNQSSLSSSTTQFSSSEQTLSNIINKVGPLIGLLTGGSDSSPSLSSPSPLSSSFSQSNESFGVSDHDNQSSFTSSTTQSWESHQTLTNILNKIGPLLSLLMNGYNSSSDNMDYGQGLPAFFSNDTNDSFDNSSSLSATNDFGTSESAYALS